MSTVMHLAQSLTARNADLPPVGSVDSFTTRFTPVTVSAETMQQANVYSPLLGLVALVSLCALTFLVGKQCDWHKAVTSSLVVVVAAACVASTAYISLSLRSKQYGTVLADSAQVRYQIPRSDVRIIPTLDSMSIRGVSILEGLTYRDCELDESSVKKVDSPPADSRQLVLTPEIAENPSGPAEEATINCTVTRRIGDPVQS